MEKLLYKRGYKYPETVMNQTKSNVSVMFTATGDVILLPPYVMYRAKHLYGL